ncbi:MAG TPA: 2-oxoacid:acceptor oxidoreductase family protein [Candidatus Tripitaka californicus]|uniref:2-oxoacid:acceptor oxidoreductase family protein n=1 Tax=Candidatus Tripitaka californicus TaxID=3367616 RepID=UPI0040291C7E
MYTDLMVSGFGGQGVLIAGRLLSYAAMREDKHVTFFPAYGPIMRGGEAHCTVVISTRLIGSPVVRNPLAAIVMNLPSLLSLEPRVKPGGLLIANVDLADRSHSRREDIKKIFVPANTIAEGIGSGRASMVALGAYIEATRAVTLQSAISCLDKIITEKHREFLHLDEEALKQGALFSRQGTGARGQGL